jgi:hypothetical protein
MKGSIEKAVTHELDTLFADAGSGAKASEPSAPRSKKAPPARKEDG